jgi:DNA-directed RNA polymerase specialized sigma24 family protein
MSNFPLTNWSGLVHLAALAGRDSVSPDMASQAEQKLNELCTEYWYPLYAFARSWGRTHEEAEDLTQDFFHYVMVNHLLVRADRNITKFRTLLLTHFRYLLSNDYREKHARKRGSHFEHLPLDYADADERYQGLLADGKDPELVYDQAWADDVVRRTLVQLENEYRERNIDVPFAAFKGFLPGGAAHARPSYEDLHRLYPALTADALKKRASRLNLRFREILVSIISTTVADPAEVQLELNHLVRVLTLS